jgi:parallel beta-helix repeat protein
VEAGTYYENVVVNKTVLLLGESVGITIIDANGTGNVVDVKADGVVIESFTVQNSGYDANGIHSDNCKGTMIRDNNIINNDCGINIWYSANNTISGNNVTNNYFGIFLQYSYDNTLRNNHMSSNQRNFCVMGDIPFYFIHDIDSSNTADGKPIYYWVNQQNRTVPVDAGYVALIYSTNITAQNLDLKNNYQGLLLVETENSLIMGNNITNNTRGIHLIFSSNNTISENNMTNNGFGIFLDDAVNNTIFRNNIAKNYYGVSQSTGNIIYHNNFINNTQQVLLPESFNTAWDDGYPSGGNYWSDYVGVDVKSGPGQDLPGSDGIGDTPYIIDADNQDRYPLMRQWTLMPTVYTFSIVWEEETFTVSVESNSTVSNFAFNQPNKEISFYVTGPDGTIGFSNVTIPKQLLYGEPWSVLIDGISVTPTIAENETHSILYFTYTHSTHKIQIIGTYVIAPPPPPLSVSTSPLSASILVGQSVTFTSTVSGGYSPYSYQWYLNGNPVSGATSNTWTFTPATSGIYYAYLKVTDAKANTAQSDAARIAVATVPVGGYSFSIQVQTRAEPIIPYIALIATLTAVFTKLRPKTKRKR